MTARLALQERHDHGPCMRAAMAEADALAQEQGLRFTPLRRRVLEILLESHRPVGAYEVLAALAVQGTRPAPPTVYRALDFLIAAGLVHRIDTQNAYIACFAPGRRHRTHFLLCRSCGAVTEIEHVALQSALVHAAAEAGFAVERETVEISGLCAACAAAAPSLPYRPLRRDRMMVKPPEPGPAVHQGRV